MISRFKKQILTIYPFLFIILFLALMSFSGVFVHLNALIYDKTIELSLNKSKENKPLLLVEIEQDELKNFPSNFSKIQDELISLDPKSLVFLINQKNNIKNIEILKEKVPIFLATQLVFNSGEKKIYKPLNNDIPKHLKNLEAYISLPQIEVGTYRFDFDSFDTVMGKRDSLTRKIDLYFSTSVEPPFGRYYINFNNHTTLPKITFQRLMQDGLISELIKDHHIVFGLKKRVLEVGLNTPAIQDAGYLTVLQYFGYSLLTLLEDNTIVHFNIAQEILIMMAFLLFGLILHGVLKIKFSTLTVFVGFVFVYLLTWSLLNFFISGFLFQR